MEVRERGEVYKRGRGERLRSEELVEVREMEENWKQGRLGLVE